MTRGSLHLVVGPVGAGKTTFANREAARVGAVFFNLDSWMVRLFGEDERPDENVIGWYLERRTRCRELMWDLAQTVLDCGTDVFLELGHVKQGERETFYQGARDIGLSVKVYALDAPRELRRRRVSERNAAGNAHTQIVPPEFFELASDSWEPPSPAEQEIWSLVSE